MLCLRADEASAGLVPRVSDSRSKSPLVACLHRGHIFGGAEECLLFNARDLMRRGYELVVLCLDAFEVADRFEQAGIPVVRLVVSDLATVRTRGMLQRLSLSLECRSKRWRVPVGLKISEFIGRRHLRAVRAALESRRPQVLFANMNAGGDYHFMRQASDLGIGTVSHQQITPPAWVGRRLLDDVNRFCDGLMSNSQWTRSRWIAQGMRPDRHEVIYNTLLPVAPVDDDLRRRVGIDPSKKLVVSIGRLSTEKQFDTGIRAFAKLARDFPDWHYVIIGDGDEKAALLHAIEQAGVAGRVHLTGALRNAAGYLGQVEVLLHPTPAEHLGRVVAEAMVAGATAVGHASGGVPEMIVDGETGHLFTDEASMERVLRQVMSKPRDEAMRQRARAHIDRLCGTHNSDKLAALIGAAALRASERANA